MLPKTIQMETLINNRQKSWFRIVKDLKNESYKKVQLKKTIINATYEFLLNIIWKKKKKYNSSQESGWVHQGNEYKVKTDN